MNDELTITRAPLAGVTPLRDFVLIERDEAPSVSEGGIVLPASSKGDKPATGVIVAAGEGRDTPDGTLIPTKVRVGENVLFSVYAGTEIQVRGKTYLVMQEKDIIAILDPL